jgi:hypothetical protein
LLGGFYNVPSLRPLWDSRERRDGILVPRLDSLLLNKLLHARDNLGKDNETVALYFKLEPQNLAWFLEKIRAEYSPEDRETMLHALYVSLSSDMTAKKIIERAMLKDLEDSSEPFEEPNSHPKPK